MPAEKLMSRGTKGWRASKLLRVRADDSPRARPIVGQFVVRRLFPLFRGGEPSSSSRSRRSDTYLRSSRSMGWLMVFGRGAIKFTISRKGSSTCSSVHGLRFVVFTFDINLVDVCEIARFVALL